MQLVRKSILGMRGMYLLHHYVFKRCMGLQVRKKTRPSMKNGNSHTKWDFVGTFL